MKTVTEFAGPTLKNAAKIKQELITAGKTPEELPQAMGEALKLEGDKLNFILNALEVVGTRLDDLKRVVVLSPTEGEKVTGNGVQKGEQYYRPEHYPPLHGKGRGGADKRSPRGDKDHDRKRRKRRGRGSERSENAPNDGRPSREAGGVPSGPGEEGRNRRRRPPSHRRGPGERPGEPGKPGVSSSGGPPRLPKPRETPVAPSPSATQQDQAPVAFPNPTEDSRPHQE